jgi:hypothetical protein
MKTNTMLYIGAGVAGIVAAILIFRGGSKVASAAAGAAGRVADAINPINPNNVFSQAANAVTQSTTGTPNSLGTWLAEKFDPTTRAADKWARENIGVATDSDDKEMGKAMQTFFMNAPPAIDIGGYYDDDEFDAAAMARFNAGNTDVVGPAMWDSNSTARLIRRPVTVRANSEYE